MYSPEHKRLRSFAFCTYSRWTESLKLRALFDATAPGLRFQNAIFTEAVLQRLQLSMISWQQVLRGMGLANILVLPVKASCCDAGYGGGMSSAKAALESDTRVLAYEAGRKFKVRVNTISAGPLGSRAAKAIGFIEDMIR